MRVHWRARVPPSLRFIFILPSSSLSCHLFGPVVRDDGDKDDGDAAVWCGDDDCVGASVYTFSPTASVGQSRSHGCAAVKKGGDDSLAVQLMSCKQLLMMVCHVLTLKKWF